MVFKSGGKGSGLFITYDGGENWIKKTSENGLPKGDLGRIGLAISKSKSNIVYALVESKKNALYKSVDGEKIGKKLMIKEVLEIVHFITLTFLLILKMKTGFIVSLPMLTYQKMEEEIFKQLMPAYGTDNGVHPDHHAWWIDPNNGSFIIDGNDGGLNISRDGGKSWRFIGNIPVAQFYHISVDNEFPYNVYGGMQDNGSWRGPSYVWKAQGIRNSLARNCIW